MYFIINLILYDMLIYYCIQLFIEFEIKYSDMTLSIPNPPNAYYIYNL